MSTNDSGKGLQVDHHDRDSPRRTTAEPSSEASKSSELAESATRSNHDGNQTAGKAADTYALAQTASINRLNSHYTEASEDAGELVDENTIAGKRKWAERLNPLKRKRKPPIPKQREVSHEHQAGFFSKLTFHWMAPLMKVGYQRPLELNDIWLINPDRSVDIVAERLQNAFDQRVARGSKRPLLGAIYESLRFEFLLGGVCQFVAAMCQVIAPFVLRYLIEFAGEAYVAQRQGIPGPSPGRGWGLVVAILALQAIQSLATSQFVYRGMTVGGGARGALISVIFDKAMRISARAKAGGAPEEPSSVKKTQAAQLKRKWYNRFRKNKPGANKASGGGSSANGEGWGNGRIVNLMSTDTYRIDQASAFFHMIWTAPIQVIVALILLLVNLKSSALAGFALLIITLPLLGRAIRSLLKRRMAINKVTDQRVTLTQEILQAVRFVKFFGWETSFLARIAAIRSKEIRAIQILLAIRNGINAVSMSMPIFASMLTFITYSLTDNDLDPALIFSSLALFNALRLPLNILPLVISQVVDALSSIRRIQEFLLAEDMHEDINFNPELDDAIIVGDATFTWERTPSRETEVASTTLNDAKPKREKAKAESKPQFHKRDDDEAGQKTKDISETSSTSTDKVPFSIQNISLNIGRHELVAIIGSVGSGKSSLLAALAGDMRKVHGEVTIGASRAFCPQYAWIQNATVRENIIFGKPYDRARYDSVVDACALRQDFDMLPDGDRTEIGERGITLSGGQKQRLNIARAVYFDSDIILMDDPLSAVDAHVGRHIMDHAILGLLGEKCRVLATHQLHVLRRCSRVVWMQDGIITAVDTFDNLMSQNEAFAKLLASTSQEEDDDDESEEADDVGEAKGGKGVRRKKHARKLMQTEERAVKSVSWGVYLAYIRASGSIVYGPLVIFLLIISHGANIVTSLWLSWWTSDQYNLPTGTYIGIYAALGFVQALLMFIFAVALSVFGTRASKVMLHRAITRVLRAPMSFFDTTPLGRITNRFGKDVDIMDNNLTDAMRMFFITMAMIISVFILIIVYFPYFAVALAPLLVMFVFSANFYRASAREVKRHESLLRSDVFAKFGEAVYGTSSIRAYNLEDRFLRTIRAAIDQMNSAYFLTFSNQRWLSIRLDAIGNLLVFVTSVLVVTNRFDVNPSIAGLVLSYILAIVQILQFTVRQLAEVENDMNATERIHYYGTHLEEEPPLRLGSVPPEWPEKGEIEFDNVEMRYRPGLPLVLDGLTMHVHGGERVGIVGRTGAGKSSIMSTLFRLTDLSAGSIRIDGIDIGSIGLHDLRSRLAIIPQDPTLFHGTVRSNLDPFGEHSDLELWSALRKAGLVSEPSQGDGNKNSSSLEPNDEKADNSTHPQAQVQKIHLDATVEEEGLNFSLGQRQLMALARALVRHARIIVCDEATSSVDVATDQEIQRTMAEGFRGCTLLCIAHRLRTIIGYDRIVVMENGRIKEMGTPLELFDQMTDSGNGGEWSVFRGMCERSGIRRADVVNAASASASASASTTATATTTTTAGPGKGDQNDAMGSEERAT